MKEQIQKYLEAIKASYADISAPLSARHEMVKRFNEGVAVMAGSKYLKVVIQGSVHSFIVAKPTPKFKVGDILMAKSYKAPATNFSRGNILDPKFNFKTVRWVGVA
jgi:hypothetical protein